MCSRLTTLLHDEDDLHPVESSMRVWTLWRTSIRNREVRKLESEEKGGDRYEESNKSQHYCASKIGCR